MRPGERHGGTGRLAQDHRRGRWHICRVPELFRKQTASACEAFHRLQEARDVAVGGELVVSTLASKQRPGTANADAREWASVGLLPVAVVGVAVPTRALRH